MIFLVKAGIDQISADLVSVAAGLNTTRVETKGGLSRPLWKKWQIAAGNLALWLGTASSPETLTTQPAFALKKFTHHATLPTPIYS
jgi:flagellar biosynthesis component FlhA